MQKNSLHSSLHTTKYALQLCHLSLMSVPSKKFFFVPRTTPSAPPISLIRDVSFSVVAGETVALMGASGSGKSLLAMSIMGLLPPNICQTAGNITCPLGKPAIIMQNPEDCFDPLFTIRDTFIETFRDNACISRAEEQTYMESLLRAVGFDNCADVALRYPFALSGGMLHRVMIALALAVKAPLIIADEPFSGLDAWAKEQVMAVLRKTQSEYGFGLLYIDHNMSAVRHMADKVLIMDKGQVVEEGDMEHILCAPQQAYTQKLVQAGTRMLTHTDTVQPIQENRQYTDLAQKKAIIEPQHVYLQCNDVCKAYVIPRSAIVQGQEKTHKVLRGVSMQLAKGESVGLIGENGAGKSTLLRILLGLEQQDSGSIRIMGEDIEYNTHTLSWRKHIQAVFQASRTVLNPRMSIAESLKEPLYAHGMKNKRMYEQKIRVLLDMVELPFSCAGVYPRQLSGGQLQRVCIARALAIEPKILLLDEPLTDLDAVVGEQLQNLLSGLKKDLHLSFLYISHDLSSVLCLCDRIVVLHKGLFIDNFLSQDYTSSSRHTVFQQMCKTALFSK